MRTARWLLLSLLCLPTVAAAQVYIAPPPFAPQVQIQGRVYFQWGRRRVAPPAVYYAAPPPVYYAPPPPPAYYPPAVVYQPPAPVYVAPPPPVYPYPYAVPAAPMGIVQAAPARPQWDARFGLGATYEGLLDVNTGGNKGMGFLGQLRYRAARHLSLEIMSGYERSQDQNNVLRTDVPVTFGLLIPFLGPEHVFSPYVVAAGGVNFADLHLVDAPGFKLDDSRTQVIGQIGGGLELRLGRHFAINGDVRLEGRWNVTGASDQVKVATVKVQGQPEGPIADSVGLRLGVGATVYF